MIKLEMVHDQRFCDELNELVEAHNIKGFTTMRVHRSFGIQNGNFKIDAFSGEKYYTFMYFHDDDLSTAKKLRDAFKAKRFFSTLTKVQEI